MVFCGNFRETMGGNHVNLVTLVLPRSSPTFFVGLEPRQLGFLVEKMRSIELVPGVNIKVNPPILGYPLVNVYITLQNYGKSEFLMGLSTIKMPIFKSFLYVYQT